MVDVLIVDDELNFLNDLAEGLRMQSNSMYVIPVSNAEKALEILNTAKIDVVLTDLNMPGMSGIDFLKQVCETRPRLPVVIMSACERETMKHQLQGLHFAGYLEKPVDLGDITRSIMAAAETSGQWEGETKSAPGDFA